MQYQFRPIDQWPGQRKNNRKKSPFGASFNRTLQDLDRELRHLGAKNIVIQAAVTEDDIRLDGMLRAGASPRSPGIILSFESKIGWLSYPCDTYSDWQGNLRAIALALAALRAVDRYGVTSRAEQYKGWQALPPPAAKPDPYSTLSVFSGWAVAVVRNDPSGAYRAACVKTHPDAGGNPDHFKQVQSAYDAIQKA